MERGVQADPAPASPTASASSDPTPDPPTPLRFSRVVTSQGTSKRRLHPSLSNVFGVDQPDVWGKIWELCRPVTTGDNTQRAATDSDLAWLAFFHWPVVGYTFHVYAREPPVAICDLVRDALVPFPALQARFEALQPPRDLPAWTQSCLARLRAAGIVLEPSSPARPSPPVTTARSKHPARSSPPASPSSAIGDPGIRRSPPKRPTPRSAEDPRSPSLPRPGRAADDVPTQPEAISEVFFDGYFDGSAPSNKRSANQAGGAG